MMNSLLKQAAEIARQAAADYREELDEVIQEARGGDVASMYSAAWMMSSESSREPNIEQAIYWYQQAIENGHPLAANNLGCLFDEAGNSEAAFECFEKAANSGDTQAMRSLAWALSRPERSALDKESAREWLRKAADLGNEKASYDLAKNLMLYDAKKYGWEIIERTARASNAGVPEAMFQHAKHLWSGESLPKNRGDAEHKMRILAGQGHEAALDWLDEHQFTRIEEWEWIPKLSFGPIKFTDRIEDWVDELGLVQREDDCGEDYEGFSWDSSYYPICINTSQGLITGVDTFANNFVDTYLEVFFGGTDFIGIELKGLLELFDTKDFAVSENYSLSDCEISSEAYDVEFAIQDGVVEYVTTWLDRKHSLWED